MPFAVKSEVLLSIGENKDPKGWLTRVTSKGSTSRLYYTRHRVFIGPFRSPNFHRTFVTFVYGLTLICTCICKFQRAIPIYSLKYTGNRPIANMATISPKRGFSVATIAKGWSLVYMLMRVRYLVVFFTLETIKKLSRRSQRRFNVLK